MGLGRIRLLALAGLFPSILALVSAQNPVPNVPKSNPPGVGGSGTPPRVETLPKGNGPPKITMALNTDMVFSRETPRKLLETFYFAIEGADYRPELIGVAAQCLDNRGFLGNADQLALYAVNLGEILDFFSIAHIVGSEKPTSNTAVLLKDKGFHIVVKEIPGDGWKFDVETVSNIPEMRRELTALRSTQVTSIKGMAEGRNSPEATARTFRSALVKQDFIEGATCLDPNGHTSRRWALEGPGLARKLAFIIQRCGFLFLTELSNEPVGLRQTIFASPHGRITLDRVLLPEGKEAWVFDRTTVLSIPSIYEAIKKLPPDPRWVRLGIALDDSAIREDRVVQKTKNGEETPDAKLRPEGLPLGLESPKAALETFFKEVERLRVTNKATKTLDACLDLEPARKRLGISVKVPRVSIVLDAILRSVDLDSTVVSDFWNDDPQTIKGPNGAEITLRRTEDGSWKFDFDTLIRMPDMFAKLAPGLKTAREKQHDFDSPRSTFATFEWAMYQAQFNPAELKVATECLDGSDIPIAARSSLVPRIAWKLRYLLDHELPPRSNGQTANPRRLNIIQMISNQPDGRRWAPFRDDRGEILRLARVLEGPNKDKWLFSADSLPRIERLFRKVIGNEVLKDIQNAYPREANAEDRVAYWFREGPDFWECPSIWIHLWMSPFWRSMTIGDITIGLERWQWLGLGLCFFAAYFFGWLGTKIVQLFALFLVNRYQKHLHHSKVFQRLGPIRIVIGFAILLAGIDCLDLPMQIEINLLPICKAIWALLLLWTCFGIADLGRDLWSHQEDSDESSNIKDLLLPTLLGLIKAMLMLGFGYYLIRIMGDEDLLGRILAGIGILTLGASLAAQDAIKNYFGTLLLASERPFRIGDRVMLDKVEGIIERVGYRSTRVRTEKGSLVTIPNSKVIEGAVENFGRRHRHFERLSLPLSARPSEESALAMTDEISAILRVLCPRLRKPPRVEIGGAERTGPSLIIFAWLPGWGGNPALVARDKFLMQVASVVATHGLVITGPPQTPATYSKQAAIATAK